MHAPVCRAVGRLGMQCGLDQTAPPVRRRPHAAHPGEHRRTDRLCGARRSARATCPPWHCPSASRLAIALLSSASALLRMMRARLLSAAGNDRLRERLQLRASSSLNTSPAFGLSVLIVVSPFPNAETLRKTNASYLWDGTLASRETVLTVYSAHTLIVAMYGQRKTPGQISELLEPAAPNQACSHRSGQWRGSPPEVREAILRENLQQDSN